MGGTGSTRWGDYTRKTRAEECRVLDVSDFTRQHAFQGQYALGIVEFPSRRHERFPLHVHFSVEPLSDGNHLLTLKYFVLWEGPWEEVVLTVLVQKTRPYFGGVRWWFTCPCTVNCLVCARRVRMLYLPPGERYFGCRYCHDLTYRSVQEHDKRMDYLLKHPPVMLDRIKNGSPDLLTRIAYTQWFDRYLLILLD